jgi:hypothetical protein
MNKSYEFVADFGSGGGGGSSKTVMDVELWEKLVNEKDKQAMEAAWNKDDGLNGTESNYYESGYESGYYAGFTAGLAHRDYQCGKAIYARDAEGWTRMPEQRITEGIVQEIVETETEIIFLGKPSPEVNSDGEDVHNCDQMGCGQCHVLYRCLREAK